MINLTLPDFNIVFPPARLRLQMLDHGGEYAALAAKLANICQNVGKGSDGFKRRKEQLRRAAPVAERMINVMTSPKYIRPLLALWQENVPPSFAYPIDLSLLRRVDELTRPKKRMSRMALLEFTQIYFRFYDELSCLETLCSLINKHINYYAPDERLFGLNNLRKRVSGLISPDGHKRFVQLSNVCDVSLDIVAKNTDIPIINSRFFEASTAYRYLRLLERLSPNEEHPVLQDIRRESIYKTRINKTDKLGHAAVSLLIDKLDNANLEPSQDWRATILSIAGDPRVSSDAPSFIQWWWPLDTRRPDDKYSDIMKRWLSRVDLKLFLDILRQYATISGNDALARMYPARAQFLNALFEKNLVRETKLYLAPRTAEFIKLFVQKEYAPQYIRLTGINDLAIFYLNLGRAHMVDGTHNISLRLVSDIPKKSAVAGYPEYVNHYKLREGFIADYIAQFGNIPNNYAKIPHMSNTWQNKAINALRRMGVYL